MIIVMKSKKILKITVLVLLMALVFPFSAFAQGSIDVDHDTSLSIQCNQNDNPISNVSIDVYRIASVDSAGEYTLVDKFKAYEKDIDFDNMGGEKGDGIAEALRGYVERDNVSPDMNGITNEKGLAVFAGKDMNTGIYLVIGKSVIKDSKKYSMTPFIVAVPERDNDNNAWNYNVTAYPKCSAEDVVQYRDIEVVKIWKDEGKEASRPEKITVELLKDGEKFDSVTITEEDNWKHKWTDLDASSEWTVAEKEIKGYTVAVAKNNDGFAITNTNAAYVPGNGGSDYDNGGKLPQTGQLWWPVPVLLILGLVFLSAGIIRRNRSSER